MIARILRLLTLLELLAAGAIATAVHDETGWPWIAAATLGIGAPLAVHAWFVGVGFVLSAPHAGARRRRTPLTLPGAAKLYLREVWNSMRAFQVEMAWMPRRRLPGTGSGSAPAPVATRTDAPLPVVLIHGYFCNHQVWQPMATALAARGHAVEAIDLEPAYGSIDEYAAPIDAAVRRLCARTGVSRVALVCHSMGGLAGRAYLRAYGATAVAGVVTLGTPHRGTVHARYGLGVNAAQMRIASRWLDALAASESVGVRALMTIVISIHDNVVCPQETQTLPGAAVVELAALGHLTLVYDPGVHQLVVDTLARIRSGSPASVAGTPPGPR